MSSSFLNWAKRPQWDFAKFGGMWQIGAFSAAAALCICLLVQHMWSEVVTFFALIFYLSAWLKKPALVKVKPNELQASFSDAYDIAMIFLVLTTFGFYVVARVELSQTSQGTGRMFTGLLWSLACFVAGAILGFLFGVPKVVQESRSQPARDQATGQTNIPGTNGIIYQQRVNSNLEDISDWLTKIIVGIGLVELGQVYNYFKRAAGVIGIALTGLAPLEAQGVGAGVIILFVGIGFLASYLLTRLFLAGALQRAERDLGTTPPIQVALPTATIVPEGATSESQRDPAGFYTKAGIIALVGKEAPGENVVGLLQLFDTPKQRTWLVATDKRLFCILDDVDTRSTRGLIQWILPLDQVTPIHVKSSDDPTYGLVDIGNETDWFYSRARYPDPEQLRKTILKLVQKEGV